MNIFNILKKYQSDELDYEKVLFRGNKVDRFSGNIKMLIITDTHGDLFLNKDLQQKLSNIKEYDICCILGDIHDNDYKIILDIIPKNKIVSLLGNHDRFNLINDMNLRNLNGDIIEVNGIKIGGIQGCHKYKEGNFPSFTHEESIKFMSSMLKADILISHDKPFTCDCHDYVHDGLKGITKYLYDNNVSINIHGHIHKNYERKLMNGSIVRGVFLIELIEIEDGCIKNGEYF